MDKQHDRIWYCSIFNKRLIQHDPVYLHSPDSYGTEPAESSQQEQFNFFISAIHSLVLFSCDSGMSLGTGVICSALFSLTIMPMSHYWLDCLELWEDHRCPEKLKPKWRSDEPLIRVKFEKYLNSYWWNEVYTGWCLMTWGISWLKNIPHLLSWISAFWICPNCVKYHKEVEQTSHVLGC